MEITLPIPAEPRDTPDRLAAWLELTLAMDVIADRLSDDAALGAQPFTSASVSDNENVRGIDAPSVYVSTDGAQLRPALEALAAEFARVSQHGVGSQELARAVARIRAAVQDAYDGRDSVQDYDYADQYVSAFLEGTPYPAAQEEYDLANAILSSITPESVSAAFTARRNVAAPHVLIVGPQDADAPTVEAALQIVADADATEQSPRDDLAQSSGELLADAPDAVEETSSELLIDEPSAFLEPTHLVFPNGLQVVIDSTPIAEGEVTFEARSPGGLSVVSDTDLPAAIAATGVVGASGLGTLDVVQLDQVLADRSVGLQLSIEPTQEAMYGGANTSDLETLLQLVHLYFTSPRADQAALDNYVAGALPFADDPTRDPDTAGFLALADARWGDAALRWTSALSRDQLLGLTAPDIERVFGDRFANPGDWIMTITGDLDVGETTDLVRTYLGSLPGTGVTEAWVDLQPDPPSGITEREVQAGTGDKGSLTVLYTVPWDASTRDELTLQLLSTVMTSRLTDHVREELGASYSPYAVTFTEDEPDHDVVTYVQITGDPAGMADLAAVLQDDLRQPATTALPAPSSTPRTNSCCPIWTTPATTP
ncbi:MAG: insulinase family protein [Ilumatobacteraceae bacterium]